jgi:ATP-binding cassette subfamily B protein
LTSWYCTGGDPPQLITIARAFIARPQLLILDEATSSVDSRTDVLIAHATRQLRRDRTSFIIAHRLSTIRNADHIVAMVAGRIVEQGSHRELMTQRGVYYAMTCIEMAQNAVAAVRCGACSCSIA